MTTIISIRLFNYFKTTLYRYISTFIFAKVADLPHQRLMFISAVTRIRTLVVSATTRSTNHYTITAIASAVLHQPWQQIISVRLFNYFKTTLYKYISTFIFAKVADLPHQRLMFISAVTRIRTWVVSATTRSTNHYTITAIALAVLHQPWQQSSVLDFSIILRQLYINI